MGAGGKVLIWVGSAFVAGGAAAVLKRILERPASGPASHVPESEPGTTGSANERLRRVALELLPSRDFELGPPSPTWDLVLGGKRPDAFGGKAWRYYQQYAGKNEDGSLRKGGTTCGIFAAACAARAGWDRALINRAEDDAWAPGSGFTPGAHIYKLLGAAEKRGWVHKFAPAASVAGLGAAPEPSAAGFQLLPGDYYYQDRKGATYDGKPVDGGHVGIVLDATSPDASGVVTVTTADGGFTNRAGDQCAVWHTRKFTPADGRIVLEPFKIEAKIVSVVRPT